MSCPTCSKPFPKDADMTSAPFCSDRCKAIDLGKWLNEEYVIHDPIMDPELEERVAAQKVSAALSGRDPKNPLH
jgi:endogenous inhibitor of DNA gyrase (YacG/DUF329 family)